MNTFMIKRIGLIALGGVAGGLIGYFVATLIIKQLEQQEYFEEEEENIDIEIKTGVPEIVKPKEFKVKDYTKYTKGELAELVKPYTKPETTPNSKQDNIKIISFEEYESNRSGNRELITYYAGDATFSDANEEIIPNPEDFFVPNVHLHFGEESEDPDIVYIRNENNGVDYEITQVPGKYSVIIMGMPDEEPKPKPKPKRRRGATQKELESFESEENEGED